VTVADRPLVVIGVGSVLRADDAIGIRVVEGLRALTGRDPDAIPGGARLVDGGILGLDLLPDVREARGLVLVDAVRLGGLAGTVSVLDGDAISAADSPADRSTGALGELLATARLMGWLPGPVSMVGIEVADIGFGVGLSPAVADALPIAMDAVRRELHRMDVIPANGMACGGSTVRMAGATA
jgi:hydrogenase maturation protease